MLANSLTIGPNGRVNASIHAREIIIHGRVSGNIRGVEKVELRRSSNVVGDIATQRIAIEEGAYFKGGVDLQKLAPPVAVREPVVVEKPAPKTERVTEAAAPAAAGQSTIFNSTK